MDHDTLGIRFGIRFNPMPTPAPRDAYWNSTIAPSGDVKTRVPLLPEALTNLYTETPADAPEEVLNVQSLFFFLAVNIANVLSLGIFSHSARAHLYRISGAAYSAIRRINGGHTGAAWFETAQVRLLTMRDCVFHVAKYAGRSRRFVSCAFAPRVECWSATREESQGERE